VVDLSCNGHRIEYRSIDPLDATILPSFSHMCTSRGTSSINRLPELAPHSISISRTFRVLMCD